jgi:hypothetical protein
MVYKDSYAEVLKGLSDGFQLAPALGALRLAGAGLDGSQPA